MALVKRILSLFGKGKKNMDEKGSAESKKTEKAENGPTVTEAGEMCVTARPEIIVTVDNGVPEEPESLPTETDGGEIVPDSPTVTDGNADEENSEEANGTLIGSGNVRITSEKVQEALKKMKMPQEIRIDISRAPDFKQFYSIGALGVHNVYDFRISFYNDQPDISPDPSVRHIRRQIGSEIILTPIAAAELHRWLGQNLAEYEERFGPIRRLAEGPQNNGNAEPEDTTERKADALTGYV